MLGRFAYLLGPSPEEEAQKERIRENHQRQVEKAAAIGVRLSRKPLLFSAIMRTKARRRKRKHKRKTKR